MAYVAPKPGDIVRVFHSGNNESHYKAVCNVAKAIHKRFGCFVIVVPEDVRLELVEPHMLRAAGWVRAEESRTWRDNPPML